MHILLTNDDGPPSNQSSPYVHTLISTLQQAGHQVSVCLPNVQRSWIGKAHMVGQTLTPSYFRPGTILKDDGATSDRPFNDGQEEWILIDGTPASCVQIGLHHVFNDRGPIDVVLSGPNYGRNTTAVFALSSGTIGGAMEGAVNGYKSIALSYAFESREHDAEAIAAASRVSTKLIEKFVNDWPSDVHLYSINVPLKRDIEEAKIVYTEMIQNRWLNSSFTELPAEATDFDPNQEEQKIRENGGEATKSQPPTTSRNHCTYKWSPQFSDIRKSVEEAGAGDGWSVLQGHVSVTPLRASFWPLPHYSGEIKLNIETNSIPSRPAQSTRKTVYAVIDYPEPYVQPLILQALAAQSDMKYEIVQSIDEIPSTNVPVLQFMGYEAIDFDHASSQPRTSLICAYVIRKALIRKHYLSNTVSTWLVKNSKGMLARHFKPAVHFELDFSEFLDDALVDAWDLNESMEQNENVEESSKRQWWILKPGMSDGGNGIRLFSTLQDLQAIFEEWDPPEEEEEEDQIETATSEPTTGAAGAETNHEMTSQLRHFIAQPYIDPPLLLPRHGNRKFHIRTYVVAVGSLKVYVFKEMLALFAAKPYTKPGCADEDRPVDLAQHLTNTCFQDDSTRDSSVHRFWALEEEDKAIGWQKGVFEQICTVTGEVFEAAAREQMIHFQTLPNAFEIFGVDFLVDADHNVWLLELNAYPDFKQTGKTLQDVVVGQLFEQVVRVAINPFFGLATEQNGTDLLPLVRSLDLGRR